jgi:hypothetical protein
MPIGPYFVKKGVFKWNKGFSHTHKTGVIVLYLTNILQPLWGGRVAYSSLTLS